MKVDLIPGIKSISGTMGKTKDGKRLEFRTFTRSNGKTETRLYVKPVYERTAPVTEAEQRSRSRFAAVSAEVTRRAQAGDMRRRGEIFSEVYAEMFKKVKTS